MKKSIVRLCTLLVLFLVTGCTSNVELDLENIKEEVINLTNDRFSPSELYELDMSKYLADIEEISDMNSYGINDTKIEEFYGFKSASEAYFYIVMMPYEDNLNEVKNQMNAYMANLDSKNVLIEEYNDYLIYIYSDNKDKVLEEIKTSKEKIMPSLIKVEESTILDVLDIEEKWYEEFLMMQPMMMVNSSQFLIIKPSKGHEKDVKEKVNEYFEKLEEQWKNYLPAQYDLVVNRKETKLGEYLIYIVSDNNEVIYNTIKKNKSE